MAGSNPKPYNSIDRCQEEAMNTMATQLIELSKLIQQGMDAERNTQDERGSSFIHKTLMQLKCQHYLGRARLKEMVGLQRYKEHMRACSINVFDLAWITFDEEEHEHEPEPVDISIIQSCSYARKWLREKLDLAPEIDETKSETETHGIHENVDYDFDDAEEEKDGKKNVLIKKQTRYERDLYYMFHDFLKKIRDNRDPEGNATVHVYQEFKDSLKWLGSGVDNQVVKCSRMILNTVDKGIERVIGISRKGKEIVQGTKTRRIDILFDVFLRLIQHVSILWLATNWMTIEERGIDIVLKTADGCQRGFREAKLNVKAWSDNSQCRHCSGSCRRS